MTNREKYKQAFSAINSKSNRCLTLEEMKYKNKQHKIKTMVASIATCVMIISSATVAYATNVGGIQRTIQLWIHGDKTAATIEFDGNGTYSMDYVDKDKNVKSQSGGGVSFGPDGTEIPLSDEEILAHLIAPEVWYEEDGTVYIYWFDQKVNITDKFENDTCYIKLVNGKDILYMTVWFHDGYGTSPYKYVEKLSSIEDM